MRAVTLIATRKKMNHYSKKALFDIYLKYYMLIWCIMSKVLIVDNERHMVEVVSVILEQAGFQVEKCSAVGTCTEKWI